ncbi:sel1 repeat family protein [candidate division KSB1 bacterium]|nr:sel1 repeat family protein [candidate division KSB1 bacterium]
MSDQPTKFKKFVAFISDLKSILSFVILVSGFVGYQFFKKDNNALKPAPSYEIVFDRSSAMAGNFEDGTPILTAVQEILRDEFLPLNFTANDNVALRFFGGACPESGTSEAPDELAVKLGPNRLDELRQKVLSLKPGDLHGEVTLTQAVANAISHLYFETSQFKGEDKGVYIFAAGSCACFTPDQFRATIETRLAKTNGSIKLKDVLSDLSGLRVLGVGLSDVDKANLLQALTTIDQTPDFADNSSELRQLLGTNDEIKSFRKYKKILDDAERLYFESDSLKSIDRNLANQKYNEALSKFTIAAEDGGMRRAFYYIGLILDRTPNADKSEAIKYYRKAADMGDPRATKRLGELGVSG